MKGEWIKWRGGDKAPEAVRGRNFEATRRDGHIISGDQVTDWSWVIAHLDIIAYRFTDLKESDKVLTTEDGESYLGHSKAKQALEKARGSESTVTKSDGSTASYYELPEGATELQDLISDRDMNGQMAEIFRATYRYGRVAHSEKMRDAKKIKFYAEAEIKRLEQLEGKKDA